MPIKNQIKEIIKIEDRAISEFKVAYGDIVIDYIKEIKRKKADFNNNKLSLSGFGSDFVNALYNIFMVTYLFGRSITQNRIKESLEFADLKDIDFSKIPYGQAIRLMNSKNVMLKSDFIKLQGTMRAYAFTVARIEKLELMGALRESINLALIENLNLSQWQGLLPEIFDSYGVTPLKSYHLENVLRTNINTVFNAANFEGYQASKDVRGIEHFGVNDDRRRETHLELDGIYPMTDPNISNIIPPHGYQCRCGTAPVTTGQKFASDPLRSKTGEPIGRQPVKFQKVKYPKALGKDFKKDDATMNGALKRLKKIEKDKQKDLSKK